MKSAQRSDSRLKQRLFQMQRRVRRDAAEKSVRFSRRQSSILHGLQNDADGAAYLDFHFAGRFPRERIVAEKNVGPKLLRPRQGGQLSGMESGGGSQSRRLTSRWLDSMDELHAGVNSRTMLFGLAQHDRRTKHGAHFAEQSGCAQLIEVNQRPGVENADDHFTAVPRARCAGFRRECRRQPVLQDAARDKSSTHPNPHPLAVRGSPQPRTGGCNVPATAATALLETDPLCAEAAPAIPRGELRYWISVRACPKDTPARHFFQPRFFSA